MLYALEAPLRPILWARSAIQKQALPKNPSILARIGSFVREGVFWTPLQRKGLWMGYGARCVQRSWFEWSSVCTHLMCARLWRWPTTIAKVYIHDKRNKTVCIDKPIFSHVARHTYATRCLNRGIRLEVVVKLLGHSTTRITQHYAKLLKDNILNEVKDAFKKLEFNL